MPRIMRLASLCSLLLAPGCFEGLEESDTEVTDTAGTDGTSASTAPSSTTAGTSGGSASTTASDTDTTPETCGNGVLDPEEDCDDNNTIETDACVRCRNARCGDGEIWAGEEECDDGNLIDTDACRASCLNNVCGDGSRNPAAEACDDGNQVDDDDCSNTCELVGCGDGVLIETEECDDGNRNNNDACTNACTIAECGDSIVQQGVEECDDGNAIDTDACVTGCAAASCGDTFVQDGAEACDDGNTNPYDGCSDACVVESFEYSFGGATCPSGATSYFREAAVMCDSAEDALAACEACMGPGNGCANGITTCTDGMSAIDADACPNALAFVYVNAVTGGCVGGNVTDCDDAVIAATDWCVQI